MRISKRQLQKIIREEVGYQHQARLDESVLKQIGKALSKVDVQNAAEWLGTFLEENPELGQAIQDMFAGNDE